MCVAHIFDLSIVEIRCLLAKKESIHMETEA